MLKYFKRKPDYIIYTNASGEPLPQLLRWYLIPRNRFFNIYLHKTIKDDEDRALHDHPWHSLSFLIKGRLGEYVFKDIEARTTKKQELSKKWPKFRKATYAHRLFLPDPKKPAWTIFITSNKCRTWGFWAKNGWERHEIFCGEKFKD